MYKTSVNIGGMMCGMCESHINNAVRNAFPVKKVSSSHGKGISVIISKEPIDSQKLKSVIEQTGYTVTDIKTEPYEKAKFSLFHLKG